MSEKEAERERERKYDQREWVCERDHAISSAHSPTSIHLHSVFCALYNMSVYYFLKLWRNTMLKKIGQVAVALTAMSVATMTLAGGPDHMAMPSHDTYASHGNFFLGAAAGLGMFDGNYRAFNTSNQLLATAPNAGGDSFLGGLLGGYQWSLSHHLYVGVVANALYNSLNSDIRSTFATGTPGNRAAVRNYFQGGLALRLGRELSSGVTPYILAGAEAGNWRLLVENKTGGTVNSIAANTTLSASKTLVGPQVGMGVLFDVCPHWQAGLEYAHTWFGDVSFNATTGSIATHKLTADQNQMLASVAYQFNS